MTDKFLFIDQTGAIVEDLPNFELAPLLIPSLIRCTQSGFKLVLFSNQRADDTQFENDQNRLVRLLNSQGVDIAAQFHYRYDDSADSDHRFPRSELLTEFLASTTLDQTRSFLVSGDSNMKILAERLGFRFALLDGNRDWQSFSHDIANEPRQAEVRRTTKETDVHVWVDLDGTSPIDIKTGIGFFDHMLEQLAKHGGFALRLDCHGDLQVDDHHTVEDVALTLGQALREALGDKRGIGRFGFLLPMDETQAQVAIDLSGRAFAVFEGEFDRPSVGELATELVPHFFRSLSESLGAAIHVSVRGDNDHHRIEASFKAVARALRSAFKRDGGDLPTTKGTL